jgi:PIN domain nuclease of toxin-antitoxin system
MITNSDCYIIDTQSFIWYVEDDSKLPARIKAMMEKAGVYLLLSVASLWEITIKVSLGKLRLSSSLQDTFTGIEKNGFEILPIETNHLLELSKLEYFHRDPFDRLIIAQSISEEMPVISSDDMFGKYPVDRIWI